MLKKLMKTAAVAVSFMAGTTAAQADSVNSANLMLGSTGGITAIAEDGQTYSKLESTDLNFNGSVHVSMKTGKTTGFGIYNGGCGALCANGFGYKMLEAKGYWPAVYDINESVSFSVSADDYPQGLTQNTEAAKIFKACQDKASGSVVPSDVTFSHLMKVTLSVDFKDNEDSGFQAWGGELPHINHNWWEDFTVPVQVTCKALDHPQMPGGMAQDMGEFKTTDIDLFLSTFSGATSQPNPATTCKKGRILVRHETTKAGPAKFKLWTKIGGNTTSKVIDAWSSHDGNGGFKAEYIEWVSISEPTQVQAMAEDMVNSIGQSTQWKSIMLQCSGTGGNGKGGGGFTQDSLPPDDPYPTNPAVNPTLPPSATDMTPDPGRPDDPPANIQTLTGDFGIADRGAPKCDRVVNALATFRSPKSDNIHWSLDCKFQSESGVVATQPHPDGGYMAVTLVPLDVTKTVDESCTLRTVAPYGPKDHVTKAHQFVCATPSGHGASSDLQTEPKPNDANKARLDKLKAAQDARKKAEAERLRRAKIAAELAAKRKRQLEAAQKARLLKLQQERARKAAAAAAQARANALRALAAKRKNKVKVAPRRRSTTTAPAINRMMMLHRR